MGAAQHPGAFAHPQHVGAQVVVARPGDPAGQRRFVTQEQGLVTGEEVDAFQGPPIQVAQGGKEIQGLPDLIQNGPVGLVAGLMKVPALRVVQVRETPFDEGPDVVERGGCVEIGSLQALGVGLARVQAGFDAVDEIPPVAGDGLALNLLPIIAARLGVLARDAAHSHHRAPPGVGEHHGHLKQHPQLVGDGLGGAVLKPFRAVPTLKQEAFPQRRFRQQSPKAIHFLGDHQRRQGAQSG